MKNYIQHLVGFAGMSEWTERWRRHSGQVQINDNLIDLSPWLSRRFLFGLPKKPVIGASPFMGVQPSELAWISMVQWKRAVLDMSTSRVYLVSSRLRGDDKSYPDLPAFAFGVHVEPTVTPLLARFGKIDLRQVWESDGSLEITRSPSKSLRMTAATTNSEILSREDTAPGRNFADLINASIDRTNRLLPPSGGTSSAVVG